MSAAPPTNGTPDVMITVKVTYEGTTRRAKMPLREMVPRVLETSIRTFLHIPSDTRAIIERYSDSAAAYVLLDSQNMAVYKQLYRAAKAKSKLKLRVTALGQQKKTPQPASVEDEAESSVAKTTDNVLSGESQSILDDVVPCGTEMNLPLRCSGSSSQLTKTYNSTLLKNAAKYVNDRQDAREEFETRLHCLLQRNTQEEDASPSQPESRTSAVSDPLARLFHGPTSVKLPTSSPVVPPTTGAAFAVCCNSCENTIPDAHYHCSTCDDGDFDLCSSCVDQGITCYSTHHWLIKRTMVNGQIVTSTTETIAPKSKLNAAKKEAEEIEVESPKPATVSNLELPAQTRVPFDPVGTRWTCVGNMRTCNSCVQELSDREFLHCTTCEDYDLCHMCFSKDGHGHHPKHGFAPAVTDAKVPDHIKMKMSPGRNQMHHAICDGCDKYITGVRHKCLDCPDWDYCGDCIINAHFVHASHRFAPIYEPLADIQACPVAQPVHMGICCDGPLCSIAQGYPSYIRGIRYKCAVCHDLDFCANCEASPANEHNKTHPLIKFKTPVRHVSVTTTGEHQDGKRMPAMGDRLQSTPKITQTTNVTAGNSINAVQTVVDVKPVESTPTEPVRESTPQLEVKVAKALKPPVTTTPVRVSQESDLRAVFLRDSVSDGTIMPPNHVFEQTWVLRNEGNVPWPAGCSVKFVGGDYMGHVDSAHPAGISELVSASESTVCYAPLAPGQEFSFTVLLRTPVRSGKIMSYWRLTTQDGYKFGHRLWCEVSVRSVPASEVKSFHPTPTEEPKKENSSATSSTMIFPKLENESPNASIHEETAATAGIVESGEAEEYENCGEEEEWDMSDDGFMTDEEYDILDASDEEFLEEQQKKLLKK